MDWVVVLSFWSRIEQQQWYGIIYGQIYGTSGATTEVNYSLYYFPTMHIKRSVSLYIRRQESNVILCDIISKPVQPCRSLVQSTVITDYGIIMRKNTQLKQPSHLLTVPIIEKNLISAYFPVCYVIRPRFRCQKHISYNFQTFPHRFLEKL